MHLFNRVQEVREITFPGENVRERISAKNAKKGIDCLFQHACQSARRRNDTGTASNRIEIILCMCNQFSDADLFGRQGETDTA